MRKYAWTITHEWDEDSGGWVPVEPVSGPGCAPEELLDLSRSWQGRVFELIDGDREPLALGVLAGKDNGFGPLDDYGTGNYGAAGIRYLVDGEFEEL